MRNFKLLALALALVFCLTPLSACGGNSGGNSSGGGTVDETIKIGLLGPYTGSVAQYGLAVRNGAELYIKQINEKGGVNGKQIEVFEYDEEGDSAKAVIGYNDLLDKEVTAIIGDVTSSPTLAVVPLAFEDNMPMITASATAMGVTYNEESGTIYSNMFRSCFIDPFQGTKMANFAFENLGVKTTAVLFCLDDDYSIGLKDSYIETCAELGIEVVALESFSKTAVDFQGQLTNIAATNPDALFVPYYYENVALIAPQAQAAGVTAPMLGCDGWDTVTRIVSDLLLLEGAYYCSGYSTEDPAENVQAFLTDYQAEYDEAPNMFAAQGYDAAMILVAALEHAESLKLETGSDEYKQAVIDAMKTTDMECVTGHVTYDEYNNPEKSAFIINITGGESKFWGKF